MRAPSLRFVTLILLAAAAAAHADPGVAAPAAPPLAGPGDFDPIKLIGLDLSGAMSTLGVPQEVFSYRGDDASQDNVVFYYGSYLYLFWYQNRVWQVRCDTRFSRPLLGLTLGMARDSVTRALKIPTTADGDSLYFDVNDAQYPIRVRLVFSDGVLSDVYVYRSDF